MALKTIGALKRQAFEEAGLNGFLITDSTSLLYFSGVPGASSILVTDQGEDTIYVYGVNYEQVKEEAEGFTVELVKRGEDLMSRIARQAKDSKVKKLGIDMLDIESYRALAKNLRGLANLKMRNDLVWKLRKIKDERELALMKRAGEITSVGAEVACESIRPGIREIEVAAEIEYAMRRKGSWGTAFETSVASGKRSAFPHGGCTERVIRNGDLVVVDIGATYHRYCSDLTRTVVAGEPSDKQKRLYEVVRKAHEEAFKAMRPRAKTKDVDAVAREIIKDAGYGELFVHGLGHGVGLEVHELPALSVRSTEYLEAGNVVTDEPGIYVLDFGGIRIEDTVLVRSGGPEKLTHGPYSL